MNLDHLFSPTDRANAAIGQAVEWVVERPGSLTIMDFKILDLKNIVAQTAIRGRDLADANTLAMRRSPLDDTIIARGFKTGTYNVRITYSGP